MKLYLYSLALTLILLFLADTRITLSPFSISFGRGWFVLGLICISIGVTMIYHQGRNDGFKRGCEIRQEAVKEAVKKYKEELKKIGL